MGNCCYKGFNTITINNSSAHNIYITNNLQEYHTPLFTASSLNYQPITPGDIVLISDGSECYIKTTRGNTFDISKCVSNESIDIDNITLITERSTSGDTIIIVVNKKLRI